MSQNTIAPTIAPTVGRIVLVPILDKSDRVVVRPAIVVAVWSHDCINVQVFLDGCNDSPHDSAPAMDWRTSISYQQPGDDEEIDKSFLGTWHWMPYQLGQAERTRQAEAAAPSAPAAD